VKPSIKHIINLEVKKRQNPHSALIEVVIFVTYHGKGLCHSKMELKSVFYDAYLIIFKLIPSAFTKYPYTLKLIKSD
jgi:hypothetical protein